MNDFERREYERELAVIAGRAAGKALADGLTDYLRAMSGGITRDHRLAAVIGAAIAGRQVA